MSAFRGSRVWIVAGVVLALVLTAATYLLVISPARAQVASVQTQVDDATLQQNVLRHRLRDLETAAQRKGDLDAKLAAAKAALPATVDTQGLLRRVQAVAAGTGSLVGAVTIGQASASPVEGIVAVPVTLVLGGSADGLVDMLDQLQSDASRLVTVSASELKQNELVECTLSLTVQVYALAPQDAAAGGTAAPGPAAPAAGGTAAGTAGGAAAGGESSATTSAS